MTNVEVKKRKGEMGEVFASQTEDMASEHNQLFPVGSLDGMTVDGEHVPVEGEGFTPGPPTELLEEEGPPDASQRHPLLEPELPELSPEDSLVHEKVVKSVAFARDEAHDQVDALHSGHLSVDGKAVFLHHGEQFDVAGHVAAQVAPPPAAPAANPQVPSLG